MEAKRPNDDFLLHMYDQMWNNINRHILTVWHSIAAIGAIVSIFVFSEKFILGFDVAITLILFFSAWLISHVYDAQSWFDRNIAIIQRVEKNFIDIDQYHGHKGSRPLKLIEHLKIQRDIALLFVIISLSYHFVVRVLPLCSQDVSFDFKILFPYIAFTVCTKYVYVMRCEWHKVHKKAFKGL